MLKVNVIQLDSFSRNIFDFALGFVCQIYRSASVKFCLVRAPGTKVVLLSVNGLEECFTQPI